MKKYLIADFEKMENIEKPYGREPVIAIMPNGTLVCVMITGGPTEPHNGNVVAVCRSYDGGETWTKPEILFSHDDRGVWAPEIYTGFENPMMVVHTYNAHCPYKELQTFVSYTYNNGETWSKPEMISPYANGVSLRKGIKMSNGETLFPIYHTIFNCGFRKFPKIGEPDFWNGTQHICGVVITKDEGRSYIPYGDFRIDSDFLNNKSVDDAKNIGTSVDLWEPNCVEAENGHIIMYMRDSSYAYINCAESFDYGRTWEHKGSIDIPNGNTKITLEKVNDKILLVSNVTDTFGYDARTKLQIQLSEDGCRTWKFLDYVDDKDKTLFYPHTAVDSENKIFYLAYEDGVKHYINKYTFEELGL